MDIALYVNIDYDQHNINYRCGLYLHFNIEQNNITDIIFKVS